MIARDDDEPQYTVDQLVGWFEYRLEEDTPGNYRAADLLPLGLTVAEIEEIGRRAAVAAGLEYVSADVSEPDSEESSSRSPRRARGRGGIGIWRSWRLSVGGLVGCGPSGRAGCTPTRMSRKTCWTRARVTRERTVARSSRRVLRVRRRH